jgi:SAM-dependent methyltransferase
MFYAGPRVSRPNITLSPVATPRPYQLYIEQSYKFISDAVRGATRILEVGCGRGDVARLLGREGFAVTALDVKLLDPRPSPGVKFVEADFLRYEDQPFDAVIFTASLHHIHPLQDAIERAHRLLNPGGTLVADEFDLDAPRPLTTRWYYETQELLAAAGLFPAERIDKATGEDMRMRWLEAHVHQPALATGRQILTAIASRFAIRDTTRCAYLYRYMCKGLPDDEHGGRIAMHIMSTEQKRLATGSLDAVGLRVVAMPQ